MRFLERLFDVTSVIAVIGYTIVMLLICGVGVFCSWQLLF